MKRSKWVYIFGTLVIMGIILCVCLGIFAALDLLPDLSLGGGLGSGGDPGSGGDLGGGGEGGTGSSSGHLGSDALKGSLSNLTGGIRWIGIPFLVVGVVLLCVAIYKLIKKKWSSGVVLGVCGALAIAFGILSFCGDLGSVGLSVGDSSAQLGSDSGIDISGILGNAIMQAAGMGQSGGAISSDAGALAGIEGIADSIGFILNWLRLLFVLLGLVMLCLGIYKLFRKRWLSGTLLSVLGAILILLAILGFSFQLGFAQTGGGGGIGGGGGSGGGGGGIGGGGGSGDGCFGGEQHQVEEWIVDKEATCIETGLQHGECIVCGESIEKEIPLAEHQFGEWEVMKESTCVEAGYRERVCEVCGYPEKEELPLTEHQFDEDGVCVVCGAKEDDSQGGGDENRAYTEIEYNYDKEAMEEPAFRIYSDSSVTVYLRSTSYSTYTGEGWSNDLSSIEYTETIDGYGMGYLPSFALQNSDERTYGLTVQVYGSQYHVPYHTVVGEGENYRIQTSDIFTDGSTALPYSMLCYDYAYQSDGAPKQTLSGKYAAAERAYREFVKQHYLSVPRSTAEYLKKIVEEEGWLKSDPDIINKVASYVREAASYNLFFDGGLNHEADRVVAFLETYQEGVCQHFASTTVLLLRMMGIPARYTVGYVANTSAGKWMEFKQSSKHAWAEAYIDGFGWVSIESTGSWLFSIAEGTEIPAPQRITIESISASKVYDGTPLTATGLEIVEGSLLPGHRLSVVDSVAFTNVGIRDNTLRVKILDENGNDVSKEYLIGYEYGTLEIVSKDLTIETGSATKPYDGTPLICHDYTQEGLLPGHTISIGYYAGKQTDPGRSDNAVENVQIFDEHGKDVTHNYAIELIFGTLRVT